MKQILTIEQMQHLQELGLNLKPSLLHYYKIINIDSGKWYLSVTIGDISHDSPTYQYIPAYTLAEIIEMLPKNIEWGVYALKIDMSGMSVSYVDTSDVRCDSKLWFISFREKPLIDALYETLCWCLENKYIETKEK